MRYLICIVLAVATTGCGTLFNSGLKPVMLDSDPPGADVYLDGNRVGKTPISVEMEKKHSANLTFKKQGYEEKTAIIQSQLVPGFLILDLFGLIPLVIDAATSNWNDLDKGNLKVLLDKK